MGMKFVICPKCKSDNHPAQFHCWNCGESLAKVEPIDSGSRDTPNLPPAENLVAPTTNTTFIKRNLPPEKPTSRLQLGFALGICFLVILFASLIFQELHTISRIIFIVGFIAGFGYLYVKDLPDASTSAEEGGDSSGSPIPDWLGLLVAIPFVGIVLALILAVMFGIEFLLEFLIDLFITKDGAERILALVLGCVFGIIVELALSYMLSTITHLKTS